MMCGNIFKKGDNVIVLIESPAGLRRDGYTGMTGVVTETCGDSDCPDSSYVKLTNGESWWFSNDELDEYIPKASQDMSW